MLELCTDAVAAGRSGAIDGLRNKHTGLHQRGTVEEIFTTSAHEAGMTIHCKMT